MKLGEKAKHAFMLGALCSVSYFAVYIARNILGAVTPKILESGAFNEDNIGTMSSLKREEKMNCSKKCFDLKTVILLALLVLLSLSLASCSLVGELLHTHADENGDGLCDVCGEDTQNDNNGVQNGNTPNGSDNTQNEANTCTHRDVNLDGRCDACAAAVEIKYDGTLTLVHGGIPTFQVVLASDLGSARLEAQRFVGNVNKCLGKVKIASVNESAGAEKCIEILIGTVTTRGAKYTTDKYSLGYEGYTIEVIDSKLVVTGGSEEAIITAIGVLESELFGLGTGKILDELKITESIKRPQTVFDIDSLQIAGNPIENYVIATDLSNNYTYIAAESLRDAIYKSTGKRLDMKRTSAISSATPAILIEVTKAGGAGSSDEGFSASVEENGRLVIVTEFPNKLTLAVKSFASEKLLSGKGRVNLAAGETYLKNVRDIFYSEYGAVGDGVTDDSAAIKAAHTYANLWGHDVFAEEGKTYLIGKTDSTITVQTNTDWRGSTIIFDDSSIDWNDKAARNVWVFSITSKIQPNGLNVDVPEGMTLAKGQKNIGMTFDSPCMLRIENSEKKIFVRYGNNANSGDNQQEYILVDENSNVDPSTPIQYSYEKVTAIVRYSVTDSPISVGNGTVKTIAPNPKAADPDYENNYCYFNRGIYVTRSNTTLYGITQIIEGEDMTVPKDRNGDGTVDIYGMDKSYGVPYRGTVNVSYCYNVRLINSTLEGHQAYSFWQQNGSTQSRNEMGSYSLTVSNSINFSMSGVRQYENAATGELITNRQMYHGIISSHFCRNMTLTDCYLDRFDSHKGLYSATLTDSTFGFGILVIGGGTLRIENVNRPSGDPFVALRGDYNSIFDGDVVIKNCTAGGNIKCVFGGDWLKNDSGIPNYMTRNVYIDGLKVESGTLYIYNIKNATEATLTDDVNPLYLPEKIEVANVFSSDGTTALIPSASKNDDVFKTLEITYK